MRCAAGPAPSGLSPGPPAMTERAETAGVTGAVRHQALVYPWRERLEPGEGPRWGDGRLLLVVGMLSRRLPHVTTAAYGLYPPGADDGAVFAVAAGVPGSPAAFQAGAPVAALLAEGRPAGRDAGNGAGR
jgi:hypothetical protein